MLENQPFCSSKYTPNRMASGGISLVFTIAAACWGQAKTSSPASLGNGKVRWNKASIQANTREKIKSGQTWTSLAVWFNWCNNVYHHGWHYWFISLYIVAPFTFSLPFIACEKEEMIVRSYLIYCAWHKLLELSVGDVNEQRNRLLFHL